MLSKEKLADIVKDEVENLVKKGELLYKFYYILLDGEIYQEGDYDKEVDEGKRSANDIYALVDIRTPLSFDDFLFHINYLETTSVEDIVNAYLRKMGFTLEYYVVLPPAPNLKYFISAKVELDNDTEPEYLGINIYDIDVLARSLHIPQIVEQELGSQPRKITEDELSYIKNIVTTKHPLLAGYTYDDAWDILLNYFVFHKKEEYKDEARKIFLAYMNLFPIPYKVCYEWGEGRLVKTDCLKMVFHPSSS